MSLEGAEAETDAAVDLVEHRRQEIRIGVRSQLQGVADARLDLAGIDEHDPRALLADLAECRDRSATLRKDDLVTRGLEPIQSSSSVRSRSGMGVAVVAP